MRISIYIYPSFTNYLWTVKDLNLAVQNYKLKNPLWANIITQNVENAVITINRMYIFLTTHCAAIKQQTCETKALKKKLVHPVQFGNLEINFLY